jgi:hypothetical protein
MRERVYREERFSDAAVWTDFEGGRSVRAHRLIAQTQDVSVLCVSVNGRRNCENTSL